MIDVHLTYMHPLQFCICLCPLSFLLAVVHASSYLLPACTLGHLIHGPHTFIQVCPCLLSLLPAIVHTHSSFVPVHCLYLSTKSGGTKQKLSKSVTQKIKFCTGGGSAKILESTNFIACSQEKMFLLPLGPRHL